MIYLYLFGTCFHFIYVFMIIGNKLKKRFFSNNIPEFQIHFKIAPNLCIIKLKQCLTNNF